MPKSITRSYSHHTLATLHLLATLIRVTRKECHLSQQEVAERAGISKSLLQRIEKGVPKCEIGVVFEVATLLGIKLFDLDDIGLQQQIKQRTDKLALLPKSIRKKTRAVDDDF